MNWPRVRKEDQVRTQGAVTVGHGEVSEKRQELLRRKTKSENRDKVLRRLVGVRLAQLPPSNWVIKGCTCGKGPEFAGRHRKGCLGKYVLAEDQKSWRSGTGRKDVKLW